MDVLNPIIGISLSELGDDTIRDFIGEIEVVFLEMRSRDFFLEDIQIFLGRSDEVNRLEMHQFLMDIFYLLDEVYIILVQLGLSVYDGDDT